MVAAGLSIPVALNHVNQVKMEEQRAATEVRRMEEKRRERLRAFLQKEDKEYSMCMAKAAAWHRNHASAPGASLAAAMMAPTIDPEAADMDDCRRLCKSFWCAAFDLAAMPANTTDVIDLERQELQARHAKFVTLFEPLDKLPGYDKRTMYMYEPLPSTPAAPGPLH